MTDRHPQAPCGLCGATPNTTLHADGSIRGTYHRCPKAIRDGVDDPPFLWPQGRHWPKPGTVVPTSAAPEQGVGGDEFGVACPYCGAAAGVPCSGAGLGVSETHFSRRGAPRATQEARPIDVRAAAHALSLRYPHLTANGLDPAEVVVAVLTLVSEEAALRPATPAAPEGAQFRVRASDAKRGTPLPYEVEDAPEGAGEVEDEVDTDGVPALLTQTLELCERMGVTEIPLTLTVDQARRLARRLASNSPAAGLTYDELAVLRYPLKPGNLERHRAILARLGWQEPDECCAHLPSHHDACPNRAGGAS